MRDIIAESVLESRPEKQILSIYRELKNQEARFTVPNKNLSRWVDSE